MGRKTMIKKILIGLAVLAVVFFIYSKIRYDKLGPGEETVTWIKTDALSAEMFAITNPGQDMNVVMSPQGWEAGEHAAFWHIDQGSMLTPYDIFLNLAVANSDQLFVSPENMTRYRYISSNKSSSNPDGLPIGFTKSEEEWAGETYVGLTCAACHSSVITYGDTAMMIDGAPTQANFNFFMADLTDAMNTAYGDDTAFEALAARMGADTGPAKDILRQRLEDAAIALLDRQALNEAKIVDGNARVDAVGEIFNSVTAANLGISSNRSAPEAPVSYPFLWGTAQSDVVQWEGFAPNGVPGGMLIRNAGEVLGVFGLVDVPAAGERPELAYESSVNIENLGTIEKWLNVLEPPAWPTNILGPIDLEKAEGGKPIYAKQCASCHEVVTPYQTYKANLTEVTEIGTDPAAQQTILQNGVNKKGETTPKIVMLTEQVVHVLVDDIKGSFEDILEDAMPAPLGAPGTTTYKGRPLNAIWATAPYLHNGSVPTLADLLKAEDQRPRTFTLGGWEFDPVKVGYVPYNGPNAFTLDTSIPGNLNTGHTYGTDLSQDEKDALVEYMKTL